MSGDRYESVWDAIEATPEAAENMRLRATLMLAIEESIRRKGWTHAEAANRLEVTRPRVSDLVRGKIDLFRLDALMNMAVACGLRVEVRVADAA